MRNEATNHRKQRVIGDWLKLLWTNQRRDVLNTVESAFI